MNRLLISVTFLCLLVMSFFSPYLVAIILTVFLAFFLKFFRKNEVLVFGDVRKECVDIFQKFICFAVHNSNKIDTVCHKRYRIENIPLKILKTDLISFSPLEANMKFTLLSFKGEILENNIFFQRENGSLIIKEIK